MTSSLGIDTSSSFPKPISQALTENHGDTQADAPHLLHLDRVVWTDAERLSGAPCFYHTRVPVKALFDYLEGGESVTTFLDDFPGVTQAQALSAIYYGKAQLMPPGVPQPTGKTRTVPQPVFLSDV